MPAMIACNPMAKILGILCILVFWSELIKIEFGAFMEEMKV